MQCSREYLSLCSVPKALNRDGKAGPFASIYLPFVGRVFASGDTYTFADSTVAQDRSRTVHGSNIPDVFTKGFVKP